MKELVFLLEEPSAKALLESLLPRILDDSIEFRLISFDGKQDLEKQMVRKLREYLNPQARFIVMRDQDAAPNCLVIKQNLLTKCVEAGRQNVTLVRIACHELESFYLADLAAVEVALGINGLVRQQGAAKFRAPDVLQSPSKVLHDLTKGKYSKVTGSRIIGKHLDVENVRSSSFKNLLVGIRRMEQELLSLEPMPC